MVDMDKYAMQELENGSILLEKTNRTIKNIENDGHGGKKGKYENLETIVADINEQYGYDFKDFHKVVKDLQDEIKKDESLKATMKAKNVGEVKRIKFNESMQKAFLENIDGFMQIMTKMEEDQAFGKHFSSMMFDWYKGEVKKENEKNT